MAINKSLLETELQNNIDGLTSNSLASSMLSLASSVNSLDSDIQSFIALGCDLPDLNNEDIPVGSIFHVEELNVPVFATKTGIWKGLDGRTYRKDKPDTAIYGWGINFYAGLGDGTTICSSSPVQEFSSSSDWCFISAGGCGSNAINYKGQLYGWGRKVGDGTSNTRCSPIQEFCSDANWCFVHNAAGTIYHYTHAIKTDNTLWSWGDNQAGQLGNGLGGGNSWSPTQEASCSYNWCVASGGFSFSAAVKTDGTLWTWGVNTAGQLGNGVEGGSSYSSPIQEFCSATNWCFVESGNSANVALKTDGTLWGWGANSGAVGHGSFSTVCSPVQEICSATNWLRVSNGYRHSVAIKTDGTLWGMGWGACGNLGNNCSINVNSPVQEITSSTNWTQACAAIRYTVALKSTGEIFSFGCNAQGQMGINTSTLCYSSPIQEYTSATNWSAVSAASCHTLALKTIV